MGNDESLKDRIKLLEETVATLTISFFILQGQLLDMREEMNYTKEDDTDESDDDNTVTDESHVEESSHEKSPSVDKGINYASTKPKEFQMENVEYWANKAKETDIPVKEFRIEDLEYWANKGNTSESQREISIEDLERWGKHRKYQRNNYFECEVCDYSCKKSNTMKKHMNTKHGEINLS